MDEALTRKRDHFITFLFFSSFLFDYLARNVLCGKHRRLARRVPRLTSGKSGRDCHCSSAGPSRLPRTVTWALFRHPGWPNWDHRARWLFIDQSRCATARVINPIYCGRSLDILANTLGSRRPVDLALDSLRFEGRRGGEEKALI